MFEFIECECESGEIGSSSEQGGEEEATRDQGGLFRSGAPPKKKISIEANLGM